MDLLYFCLSKYLKYIFGEEENIMTASLPVGFFGWVSFLLQKYGMLFIKGAAYTLLLAIIGTVIGCIIGFLVGVVRTIEIPESNRIYKFF